ncbi:MAG: hypothetical protein WCV90_02570 [Candidatus Woesearchaeota archaeon]|jgi:hypothetical protein
MARTFPIFVGGQIKDECRGDLALLIYEVNRQRKYAVCPKEGDNFNRLTDIESFTHPILRVYFGIKQEAADKVIEQFNVNPAIRDFVYLDNLVIKSYFLR